MARDRHSGGQVLRAKRFKLLFGYFKSETMNKRKGTNDQT